MYIFFFFDSHPQYAGTYLLKCIKTKFPWHLEHTLLYLYNIAEPSARCSFTNIKLFDLDPRLPIPWFLLISLLFISYDSGYRPELEIKTKKTNPRISNDVTKPSFINEATINISINSLVIKALGCSRNLVPIHKLLCLWKNAQKIARKNKASDTINNITPRFNPFWTAEVWLPKYVPSEIISLNHKVIDATTVAKAILKNI